MSLTTKSLGIEPLSAKQIRDAERDKVYIFNVSPREHRVTLNKVYVIPSCPNGAAVSEPLVVPGMVYSHKVRKVVGLATEYEWHGDEGIDVARDIVGTAPFKDESENLTKFGVFLSMSPIPSQADIDKATSHWLNRCDEVVRRADEAYALNNGMESNNGRTASNIGKDAIEAANVLGIERPWSKKNVQMKVCEECGTSNMPTASMCKSCDMIFDEARARQRYPQKFAQASTVSVDLSQVKRGPGRPPKEDAA